MMRLRLVLPTEVLMDEPVRKVVAEAVNGSFCLLPKHIDFVAALVPGILCFESEQGEEEFLATDAGILVKCGSEVLVSSRHAVRGPDLAGLKRLVEEQFRVLDDHEKMARAAAAKLEAGLVRRFMELEEHGR